MSQSSLDHLSQAVRAIKQEAASQLVKELVTVLGEEGFTLEQVLEALADYASQNPELKGAVKALEDASMALTQSNPD
jgi:type II secretory pathway component PulF